MEEETQVYCKWADVDESAFGIVESQWPQTEAQEGNMKGRGVCIKVPGKVVTAGAWC